ncbi:uncharacterized protein KY384_004257 [Bacidia gigantensis]|uniref:uncharacterized protein n=1 Tax=Bacidia gigantensis TaxID=2732470 RepID=UPI001D046E02|nr:uncharacterized protein KY384_004257 [Bacidia gigantensis]KAG8530900.1 hypothetical protein KY384_004257 [Bacidia gigantensis]
MSAVPIQSSSPSKPSPSKPLKKPKLTHFLALPICFETSRLQLATSLSRFTNLVAVSETRHKSHKKRKESSKGEEAADQSDERIKNQLSIQVKEDHACPSLEDNPVAESQGQEREESLHADVDTALQAGESPAERAKGKDGVEHEGQAEDERVPKAAIRKPGSLHFTLGVMSLETSEKVEEAVRFLKGLDLTSMAKEAIEVSEKGKTENGGTADERTASGKYASPCAGREIEKIESENAELDVQKSEDFMSSRSESQQQHQSIKTHPFTISLTGLKALPSPKKATILYAFPTPLQPLQFFTAKLHSAFSEAGFLLPDTRKLLLHATIVNTIYALKGGRKGKGKVKVKGRLTIDARRICEEWKAVMWAEDVRVDRVGLYEMGAEKVYESCERNVREDDKEGGIGETKGKGRVVDEVYKEVAAATIH